MSEKEKNRRAAPEATKFIDSIRKIFGDDCKALYVKEGDFEIGTKPRDEDRCPSETSCSK